MYIIVANIYSRSLIRLFQQYLQLVTLDQRINTIYIFTNLHRSWQPHCILYRYIANFAVDSTCLFTCVHLTCHRKCLTDMTFEMLTVHGKQQSFFGLMNGVPEKQLTFERQRLSHNMGIWTPKKYIKHPNENITNKINMVLPPHCCASEVSICP